MPCSYSRVGGQISLNPDFNAKFIQGCLKERGFFTKVILHW